MNIFDFKWKINRMDRGIIICNVVATAKSFLSPLVCKLIISNDKVVISPSPIKYIGAYKLRDIINPIAKLRKIMFKIKFNFILNNIVK